MFTVARGTWRTAIIIPALGLAVKVPNVRIGQVWKKYRKIRTVNLFIKEARREVRYWQHPTSTLMRLFGGWVMNVREAAFSAIHGSHEMVMPTYFSVFGFANVMPAGQGHDIPRASIWMTALSVVGGWGVLDAHTWSEAANFVRDREGRLRLVDYGDPRTQRALRCYEQQFITAFQAL